MKKIILVLFASVLVGALSACGGGGGDPANETAGNPSVAEEPSAEETDGARSTEVHDYFVNEPYVVYVDTSLYLGDYPINTDACSNNLFTGTLSNTMTMTSLSNNIMTFQSDAFSASFFLDDDFPHFDGSDHLKYWLQDGNLLCVTSIGSLTASSGYDDVWIFVCGVLGEDSCGFVYRRSNLTAVKSTTNKTTDSKNDSVVQSSIEDMKKDLEERLLRISQ